MKTIITDRREATKAGLLRSGRYFAVTASGTSIFVPIHYDSRLDLEKGHYYLITDKKGKEYPTIQELVDRGVIEEKTIYRHHDIVLSSCTCRDADEIRWRLSEKAIKDAIKEFREKGFNVTREAILHNYHAWIEDLKSGYRDEKKGYHLFSPCGCNYFSVRATSIEPELDWQGTYVA